MTRIEFIALAEAIYFPELGEHWKLQASIDLGVSKRSVLRQGVSLITSQTSFAPSPPSGQRCLRPSRLLPRHGRKSFGLSRRGNNDTARP
jgi:hypothetical protein